MVGADLAKAWAGDLLAAGFVAERPSVLLAEGLLGYLSWSEVHRFLAVVDGLAAPGSWLLADVSGQASVEAPGTTSWLERLSANGVAAPRFGTDDPEGLLSAHGWDAQGAQYGDEGANYGRWAYPVAPRTDLTVPHNYLVVAQR